MNNNSSSNSSSNNISNNNDNSCPSEMEEKLTVRKSFQSV